jgi:hypothetical protein
MSVPQARGRAGARSTPDPTSQVPKRSSSPACAGQRSATTGGVGGS